ncbi:MAG: hypothetical protein WBO23_02455 [Burkholderiales bacterium]
MNIPRRQRGQLLAAGIVLIVVVALMISALGFLYVSNQSSSVLHNSSGRAYYAARSGIEYAASRLGPGTSCASLAPVANVAVGNESFSLTGTSSFVTGAGRVAAGPVTATATTIGVDVDPALTYAPHGRIWIDQEQINYTGLTATSFTGATRGVGGTTATTHANGSRISQNQCLVRSTGTSGNAIRILEAAIARATNRERAMMVYAKGTAISGGGSDRNIYFRLWDRVNNTWLAEQTSTQQVTNNTTPVYFALKFSRTRNEAILGTLGGSGDLFIHVWNGATNTWSTPAGGGPLQTGLSTTYRGFQIEYEYANDRAIIVYSNGGARNPKFAIWDGTTLDTAPVAGGFIHNSMGTANYQTAGFIRWFGLAANGASGSNEILMVTRDSNRDIWGARWTGTNWTKMEAGAAATWDASGTNNVGDSVAVAYESVSNSALFVWGDASNTRQIGWRTWTPSTATLSGITFTRFNAYGGVFNSDNFQWLRLYPRPDTDEIMAVFQDERVQLITNLWNGAAWPAAATAHDDETENNTERNFDFVWQTVPFSLGQGWLLWGSDSNSSAGRVRTRTFASPAAWGAITSIQDDTLGVNIGVLPMTGTMLAGLYQAPSSANDDIQAIFAPGSGAAWSAVQQIWSGPTSLQQGQRVAIEVSPTGSIILEQGEIF